jgi:hypothetical protein
MTYEFQQKHGSTVTVENSGGQTTVQLHSRGPGQQQSQATGFHTGEWQGRPKLYRRGGELLLTFETKDGPKALRISENQIQCVAGEQEMTGAEELDLREGGSISRMEPMRPMEPMKPMQPMSPMKPMAPMKPMEPMKPLPPMEMRMGNMHMQMGGERAAAPASSPKRFCTRCGAPASAEDRFCGACGQKLG